MRSLHYSCWLMMIGLLCCCFNGQARAENPAGRWDLQALSVPPKTYPAVGIEEKGVQGLFLEGLPWKGKPTRVFAWLGLPKDKPAGKVPGIVLIHGGGGTAHARWVRLWNERGYAAITVDLCGKVPVKENPGPRHEMGGPNGWDESFNQIDWPIEDQWPYQAVADVILAHSLLRSLPEVDADRIGVTGISWGGYLTCIVAGVDPRFRFAVPVYGCGFLAEGSCWVPTFQRLGEAKAERWLRNWDPSQYLPNARMPMLWITGEVDFAYPLACVQKSYRLAKGDRHLSIKPGMKHSHPDGEVPAEIGAFADQILRQGKPLARCMGQGVEGSRAWASFEAKVPLVKAMLVWTKDTGAWQKRTWKVQDASLEPGTGKVTAEVPGDVSAFYLVVIDARGMVASSEHIEK